MSSTSVSTMYYYLDCLHHKRDDLMDGPSPSLKFDYPLMLNGLHNSIRNMQYSTISSQILAELDQQTPNIAWNESYE